MQHHVAAATQEATPLPRTTHTHPTTTGRLNMMTPRLARCPPRHLARARAPRHHTYGDGDGDGELRVA